MKEIKTLHDLLKDQLDEEYSQIDHIQLKFRRLNKIPAFNITNKKTITFLLNQLEKFLNEKEQKFYIEIANYPDGDKMLKALILPSGKPSDKKDTVKLNIRERSCFLLREYLFFKDLFNITSDLNTITNKGAEFIDLLLAEIGLLEKKSEYSSPHHGSYKKYLINTVKTTIKNGVNHINKK